MLNRLKQLIAYFNDYIYDSSVELRKRTFLLFSGAALLALFAAIPCGLIMHEPLSATLSTLAGAVLFTGYVCYAVRKKKIDHARKVLSIIMVFLFLPAMFFTNGGESGGTPIWLLLGTIYIALILDGKFKIVMIVLNTLVTVLCWIVGYYHPEFVTTYSRGGNYIDTLAALFIVGTIIYVMFTFQNSLYRKEEEDKTMHRLFEQTATALVNAIDAKDTYTHGHSSRVAEYSRKIAEMCGKSPKECDEIYYTALLHDVGKIGVPVDIINKSGKLTEEEYEIIKQHPVKGAQILQSISECPYLMIGALYHHERYDGKGYPHHLKGTDIPETARIVAVADAYDAMTSKRSYRDPIPQQKVREEFVQCAGTQFDPEFARQMQHLIDLDTEYEMKEREEIKEFAGKDELIVGAYRSVISDGILLTPVTTSIRMTVTADHGNAHPVPTMILFDSLDGRVHTDEKEIHDLLYFEYGELWLDGHTTVSGARKMQTSFTETEPGKVKQDEYQVEAVRYKDHARIRIVSISRTTEIIIALPDSSRFAYIGLTGSHCRFSDVKIEKRGEEIGPEEIPRIAEEISYIDVPAGDIPNVQVDGYRTDSTEGILIRDGMQIHFHSKCLPTARLVWHCPFVVLFTSEDGTVNGKNYREFAFVRLDGECWDCDPACTLDQVVNQTSEFSGWDAWKKFNKHGYDSIVAFLRKGNKIIVSTMNAGIAIRMTAELHDVTDTVYAAITGDQCALTNIRIR